MRLRVLALTFMLLSLSAPSIAATRYISPTGAGSMDGSSEANAYAWSNGTGFATALTASSANDTIMFVASSNDASTWYELTSGTLTINKSGTAGNLITISSTGSEKGSWARFRGTREFPTTAYGASDSSSNSETGGALFTLSSGVSYIKIEKMRVENFEFFVLASAGQTTNITVQNSFAYSVREVIRVEGPAECDAAVYFCTTGSNNWTIDNVDGDYIAKSMVRFQEGVNNSTISNCEANFRFIDGDFVLGFNMKGTSSDGPVYNITLTNNIARNVVYADGTSYDNGDGYVTEGYTSNITFNQCKAYSTWDGGWDLKGYGHTLTDAVTFKDGNRPFRVWHGPVTINNSIAAYNLPSTDTTLLVDGMWDNPTQFADGSQGAIWVNGIVTIDNFTSLNNQYPARFDDTGLKTLTYVSGTGIAPTVGNIITGGSSGVKARISKVTGNGVSGTLLLHNVTGTFTNPETITGEVWSNGTSDGFSATTSSDGTAVKCGELTSTDSIIALTSEYSSYSTSAVSDCSGATTWNSTGDVSWVEGVSGTSPQFPQPRNHRWEADSNDMNSALYTTTKGYYKNLSTENTKEVSIGGVSIS